MSIIIIILIIAFLLFVILGLAVVNFSGEEVVSKFKEYSKFSTGYNMIEFAKQINDYYFGGQIKFLYSDKYFSDSYNTKGTLTLCSKYSHENSLAALAICAHELGHALQHKNSPKLLFKQAKRLKFCNSFAKLISPCFIAGIICLLFNVTYVGFGLIGLSLVILISVLIAKFNTIKIEKEASSNALVLLRDFGSFTDDELKKARKFLNSAKQTYVADLLKVMLKWTFLVKK